MASQPSSALCGALGSQNVMLRTPSYLDKNQFGIFYFRRKIPQDLRPHFETTIIKKSLRTGNRQEALRYARILTVQTEEQFEGLRGNQVAERKYNRMDLHVKRVVRHPDGRVEIEGLETDPEKPKEEAEAFKGIMEALDGPPPEASQKMRPPPFPTTPLRDIIKAYCNEKKVEGAWTDKSEWEIKAIFNLFERIVGDVRMDTIGYDTARQYKQTIQKLPPNLNKKALYKDKTIEEIIATGPEKTMAVGTINKNLNRMSSMFDWAKKHGYVSDNYFSDITLKNKKQPDEERDIFTKDELKLIFKDPIFTKKVHKHPYYFWLPLLGLYTGARINELCQLHLDDIRQEKGIWVFDINDKLEKRLKTPSSKRLIPIHSKLIDLGFLKFADRLRVKGDTRLFPELVKRRDGYAADASRWFGRFRKTVGITEEGKAFHSFRHTVTDVLKQSSVSREKSGAIIGHKDESTTYGRYGKAFGVDVIPAGDRGVEIWRCTPWCWEN